MTEHRDDGAASGPKPRAPAEPLEPSDPIEDAAATLRPRWLWVAFAVLALAVPLVGLWLEARR